MYEYYTTQFKGENDQSLLMYKDDFDSFTMYFLRIVLCPFSSIVQ